MPVFREKKPERKRTHSRSRSSDRSPAKKQRGPRTPSPSVSPKSKSPDTKDQIATYEQLNEEFASTWKGMLVLKKTEYPLR
jgi:hypothetical protein